MEFLTDDEASAYGRYAATPSQEELDRMLARKPAQPGTSGVIESFCHFVRFFATSQAGERWTAGHPGTFLLTLADAHDLAKRFNTRMSPARSRSQGNEACRDRQAERPDAERVRHGLGGLWLMLACRMHSALLRLLPQLAGWLPRDRALPARRYPMPAPQTGGPNGLPKG